MTISEKIAILRKRKGYSQEDLANELDVSRQSVYKWETEGATPDIAKIKKIANIFNVSFNELLDDNIDITIYNKEKAKEVNVIQNQNSKKRKYRNTFDSNEKLDTSQAEKDNGYAEGRKSKVANSKEIFDSKLNKMEEDIKQYGATSHILLQNDLAGCFFQNNKDMFFGFYFNGSIQFICPYENFINANISNSGDYMDYENQLIFGAGFGSGGIKTIGVGNFPLPQINKPTTYYLSISYFDNCGVAQEYNLSFNCLRFYPLYEWNSVDKAESFIQITSEFTDKKLFEINNKLKSLHAISKKINYNETIVREIDVEEIKSKYIVSSKESEEYNEMLQDEFESEEGIKKDSVKAVIAIILVSVLLIIISTNLSTCISNHDAAKPVVAMINQIDEVTLEDKNLLSEIDVSYSKLTDKQKKYVSNYSVYTSAKTQYDILYKAYMEDYTKDDPTRNITIDDLRGTWESIRYKLTIADLSTSKAVWISTYDKYNERNIGGTYMVPFDGSLPSSTMGSYDCMTQKKSAKLYHYTVIGSNFEDITVFIDKDGDYVMNLQGSTFVKNKQ